MRFFTRELWQATNDSHATTARKARQEWDRAVESYLAYLREDVRPHLPRYWHDFLHGEYLHDARLVDIQVGDGIVTGQKHTELVLRVDQTAADGSSRRFTLQYLHVSALELNHSPDRVVFNVFGTIFDSWGYDELQRLPHGQYRHDILFVTGAELNVTFRGFNWSRIQLPSGAPPADPL